MLIAHGGHWLVDVTYALPVVGLLIWVGLAMLKQRRDEGRQGDRPD